MKILKTNLVVDCTAAVLENDLANWVGGGEEGVVGEAVGGEDPVEVGHQGGGELRLWRRENSLDITLFQLHIWKFASKLHQRLAK